MKLWRHVSGNEIGAEGGAELGRSLAVNTGLMKLNLGSESICGQGGDQDALYVVIWVV